VIVGSSAATAHRPLLAALLAATAMASVTADAQQFGQWTWDVTLGASQRLYDNLVEDDRVSRYDQRELRLGLGINGFIVHPAVARFRLGVDGALSRFASGGALDSDRLGYRGDLGLFPRGAVPVQLWLVRQQYDHDLAERDPLSLFAVADLATSWGGRVRVRRGPLRGMLIGAERSTIEFVDVDRDQVDEREFVDWSAAGSRLQHHYRLERRLREYATVDFATEDLTLTAGEHGYISQRWRWDLSGVGIRRDLSYTSTADRQIDTFRLRSRLTRFADSGNRFMIDVDAGLGDSSDGPARHSHRLSLRYAWVPRTGVEVAPFVTFGFQETDGLSGRAPQVGVSATWSTTSEAFDALLSAIGAHGRYTTTYEQASATDSLTSLFFSVSLGHGSEDRLRKVLEAEWGREELSAAGELVDELPDLGVRLGGFGTQDRLRGRLSLHRSWRTRSAGAYLEWRRRHGSGGLAAADFTVEDMTLSMDVRSRQLDVAINAGDTTTRQVTEQHVRWAAATLGLRPWRPLAVRASYRTDTRDVDSGPNVDVDRIEAILEFTIGRIVVRAQAYEATERFQTGGDRTNRGLTWTVYHRFGGWLPIVTGPERRGVIR
jgi:hypothetical protein